MPKLYCRVNPRTQLEKRDRAGLRFTRNWRELEGIDDATLAALNEDPYLEVSDSPTVLVEVAAATPVANATDADAGNEIKTGGDAPAADAADTRAEGTAAKDGEQPANIDGQDGTGDQTVVDTRLEAIQAAIAQLDPNNAEQWLSDGKPVIDAITALTGFKVLAAERDQAWNHIKTQAAAE